MKVLSNLSKDIWADVKHYATMNELKLDDAVEHLLKEALIKEGYSYDVISP